MAQFKRFNASENDNYDTNAVYPAGTLTWDPDNGIRLHNGSTSGGVAVGGGSLTATDNYVEVKVSDLNQNYYSVKQTLDDGNNNTYASTELRYDQFTISTDLQNGTNGYQWRFENGGQFRIPGNINTYDTDIEILAMNAGNAGNITIKTQGHINNTEYSSVQLTQSGVNITTDLDGTPGGKTFEFRDTGILVLPSSGDIQNASGDSLVIPQALGTGHSPEFAGLYISGHSGNEGGEIRLALPDNTTLTGDGISIDIYQDKIRIFENGGSARGVYIDLTTTSTNAGTNLLAGGGGGTTLPLDAAGVLKNDGTGTLSWSSLDIQDLTDNGNLLNFTQTQADWEEMNAASPAYIQNKPMLVTSYNDLADKPNLFNGDYLSLTGTPSLANVATTGEYGDLINTPTSLSNFTNDPGFISASDLAVSSGGSGSLSYSNGLFTYEGPTVPTDISSLTDNTNIIPTDVSDLTDNNGLLPAAQVRYVMQNASFTAEAGKVYWLDSGTTAKTMTLPASPTEGDWVKIYDGSLNWQTYNLTVNGNGNNIRTINMGSGTWNTVASTATLNQAMISPIGPFPASFIWNGTVWSAAM